MLSSYGIGLANETTIKRSYIELPLDIESIEIVRLKIATMRDEQKRE